MREGVYRRRDKKRVALRNGFAQQTDERIVDAFIGDAGGGEEKLDHGGKNRGLRQVAGPAVPTKKGRFATKGIRATRVFTSSCVLKIWASPSYPGE